jgi:formiminoglutamase
VLPLSQINVINLMPTVISEIQREGIVVMPFAMLPMMDTLENIVLLVCTKIIFPRMSYRIFTTIRFVDYISYEEIFLHERKNFIQAVAHSTGFTEDTYTGIELDLDCIEQALSSAATPSGLTPLHARQFVTFVAQDTKTAYLHICEGATHLQDGRKNDSTGKLISYLVSDFIKESSQP